jgi:hypothetical protein
MPQETFAVITEGILASDLSAAFLGKQHAYTAGEAIEWAAALGPTCAALAALVAKPLTPPLAACAALSAGLPGLPKPHSSSTTPHDLHHSRANTDSHNSHNSHNTQHTRVKQNELFFMQKDIQPSQTCSEGHNAPNPTQFDAGGASLLMRSIN